MAQVHAGSSPVGHPFNQIRRIVFTKVLNRPTLVLNRNWQAVNVATVARALVLLWNESARVVDPGDYQTYTWEDWSKLRPADGERFIQAVRFRLRVPEVITLTDFDRLPAAAVSFSRRNIFKRDHYTCQYCGSRGSHLGTRVEGQLPPHDKKPSTTAAGGGLDDRPRLPVPRAVSRGGTTACWRAWSATSARPTARRSRRRCG